MLLLFFFFPCQELLRPPNQLAYIRVGNLTAATAGEPNDHIYTTRHVCELVHVVLGLFYGTTEEHHNLSLFLRNFSSFLGDPGQQTRRGMRFPAAGTGSWEAGIRVFIC